MTCGNAENESDQIRGRKRHGRWLVRRIQSREVVPLEIWNLTAVSGNLHGLLCSEAARNLVEAIQAVLTKAEEGGYVK